MMQTVGNRGIVKNIPFILYCSFIGLIYITINHLAENTIRKINDTAVQLKEDRWRYIDEKSQIMFLTKESELEKGASALGLEKTKVPPFKIFIPANSVPHENP
jgi:hypothetical protein